MNRKPIFVFLVYLLLLAGAAPSGLPASASPQATIVTLWHPYSGTEAAALGAVIGAFEITHPEIDIEPVSFLYQGLRLAYETAAAAGSAPALLMGEVDWGVSFYQQGYAADLSTLASPALLGTLDPLALQAVEYQGALVGMPYTKRGVLLFRNPSILSQPASTYPELAAAALAATQGGITGAHLERGFFFAAGHLYGLGGRLMDENGCPAFNDATGVEWVNLLESFADIGPTTTYTDTDLTAFQAGTTGVIIDGSWNLEEITLSVGPGNLAIDPWPTPLGGYVQVNSIHLNPASEAVVQDAAWIFIEYLLSPAAQTLLLSAYHLPVVIGVAIADPLLAQANTALLGGVSFPTQPQLAAYWEPMDIALRSVYEAGADPAAALIQAQRVILAALAAENVPCGAQLYLPGVRK